MSDGTAPFQTKNTLGLLTIDWTKQNDEPEEKSPEIIAMEQAARDVILAKKKAKKEKAARKKARSQSPTAKSASPPRARKKQNDQEEAAQLAAEEARVKAEAAIAAERQKLEADEAARLKEEQAKLAAEEAAEAERQRLRKLQKEEAEAERLRLKRIQEQEEAIRRAAKEAEVQRRMEEEEEAFRLAAEEEARKRQAALEAAATQPQPVQPRQKRRASFFPLTKDNTGLEKALRKYNNDVPFDWEKPEWTMDFGNLRHTTTISKTYGWEKPEWVLKNVLRKTPQGDFIHDGHSLERPVHLLRRRCSFADLRSEWAKPEWTKRFKLRSTNHTRRTDMTIGTCSTIGDDSVNFDDSIASLAHVDFNGSQSIVTWEKPSWAKAHGLKATEAGAAARQGINLALPITDIQNFLNRSLNKQEHGMMQDQSLGNHHGVINNNHEASMNISFNNASLRDLAWEKPSWASNPGLKRTSRGEKLQKNGNLAKAISRQKSMD